jgi:phosphinothricin acetyltransferase
MSDITIRPSLLADLPQLTEIYNHYILNTAITFNTRPLTVEERAEMVQRTPPMAGGIAWLLLWKMTAMGAL